MPKILKRLMMSVAALSTIIGLATANSTAHWVGEGLDYYFVPTNTLLFHLPYPFDFLLYFFAIVGFLVTLLVIYLYAKDLWNKYLVGRN